MDTPSQRNGSWIIVVSLVMLSGGALFALAYRVEPDVVQDVAPTEVPSPPDGTDSSLESDGDATEETSNTRRSSIKEVLELAAGALSNMENELADYTSMFVQQEQDANGVLGERNEIALKVQTRMRNETNDAPFRVYLKFAKPDAQAGREVIWGADLYDGKMAVHETSLLLSWKTIWLDPTGMLAMAGQKYPVYEIGLVNLVEKLLERGQKDVGNPDVSVTVINDHVFDDVPCELIQVKRSKPGEGEDDFSLAEIVYDPERLLILSYRSFGWPDPDGGVDEVPLIESYEYRDLKTNVDLVDQDFDVTHPDYGYPK